MMFGKWFASTYTGSMYGAGSHVFGVWAYAIANMAYGTVELNPPVIAGCLGDTIERVEESINILCQPDHRSRSKAEDGRRLVHEGGFLYRVVNAGPYRSMRNTDERREYLREAQRKHREKYVNPQVVEGKGVNQPVNHGQPPSTTVSRRKPPVNHGQPPSTTVNRRKPIREKRSKIGEVLTIVDLELKSSIEDNTTTSAPDGTPTSDVNQPVNHGQPPSTTPASLASPASPVPPVDNELPFNDTGAEWVPDDAAEPEADPQDATSSLQEHDLGLDDPVAAPPPDEPAEATPAPVVTSEPKLCVPRETSPKPPPTAHAALVDEHTRLFRLKYGATPLRGKKEFVLANTVLKQFSLDQAKQLLVTFFTTDDPFWEQGGHSFGLFVACLTRVVATDARLRGLPTQTIARHPEAHVYEDQWKCPTCLQTHVTNPKDGCSAAQGEIYKCFRCSGKFNEARLHQGTDPNWCPVKQTMGREGLRRSSPNHDERIAT